MRRYDHALAKVAAAITEKLPVGTTEPNVVRLDLADLASVAEVVRAWDGTATYPGQQCWRDGAAATHPGPRPAMKCSSPQTISAILR